MGGVRPLVYYLTPDSLPAIAVTCLYEITKQGTLSIKDLAKRKAREICAESMLLCWNNAEFIGRYREGGINEAIQTLQPPKNELRRRLD
jgi:hypothetical protein